MVRVLLLLALSACTWFDDDPPSDACTTTDDCFHDESCDLNTHTCVSLDAAP